MTQPTLTARSSGRNAYARGYVNGGDNLWQSGSTEYLAFELGKADRAAGRPAFPDAANNRRRLERLWQQAQQPDLLARVERAAVDNGARGPLL